MNSSLESTTEQIPPPAYFGSLSIENVKCFKGEQTIDLSDGHDKPALWTVILGNNNTGKTTLLRCLAYLEPIIRNRVSGKDVLTPKISNISPFSDDYPLGCLIKCKWILDKLTGNKNIWIYRRFSNEERKNGSDIARASYLLSEEIGSTIIYGYGTSRKMGATSLSETESQDNTETLFNDSVILTNAEEWLIQLDYASKNGIESARFRLEKIRHIITKGLLPDDVKNFRCISKEINGRINNFVEFETVYGWVKLRELGSGYQVTLAWVMDLAKKLFERYPNSENPLQEPAIVLIDELDLHLHPEWQRKIISFLSKQFPCTQFIATTHSPLIVQSAENINLVILEKQQDHVIIKQRPDIKTFKGWTVEEILTELMGMDDKTLSDDYLKFMHQFDEALDEDDYQKAKQAYDELDKILHPRSVQRKLLSIQMSSLMAE
jgi:ABC-type multidrug transport system ATPase subunit